MHTLTDIPSDFERFSERGALELVAALGCATLPDATGHNPFPFWSVRALRDHAVKEARMVQVAQAAALGAIVEAAAAPAPAAPAIGTAGRPGFFGLSERRTTIRPGLAVIPDEDDEQTLDELYDELDSL